MKERDGNGNEELWSVVVVEGVIVWGLEYGGWNFTLERLQGRGRGHGCTQVKSSQLNLNSLSN